MSLSKDSCWLGFFIIIFTLPVIFPMTSSAQFPLGLPLLGGLPLPGGSPLLAGGGGISPALLGGAYSPYGLSGINPGLGQFIPAGRFGIPYQYQPANGYPTQNQYTQNPYGQYPYSQTPYGQYPYTQNPYGQNPYGQYPYGQYPYGQYPYTQNPYGQNPYAQYPYSQTPYGQYPYGQNPYAPNPYAQYPYSQYPSGQYPYSQYQYAQNPYGQYPYSQNPYSQYPYSQYPYSQYPYSQNPYSQYPYSQYPYSQYPYSQNPYSQYPTIQQLQTADKSLTINDDGDEVTIGENDTLSIVLGVDTASAYQWALDTSELDDNIVEKVSNQYYINNTTAGVGIVQQWMFKATGTGTTTIKLEYVNSSGTVNTAFEVTVIVE
ncbi:MAG: protease inhibitor I42 family protein [bacterium]